MVQILDLSLWSLLGRNSGHTSILSLLPDLRDGLVVVDQAMVFYTDGSEMTEGPKAGVYSA